jgi:hypothetical protein
VPQGGILTFLNTLHVVDLELWLKYASNIAYADDTSTSDSHNKLIMATKMLEADAEMF